MSAKNKVLAQFGYPIALLLFVAVVGLFFFLTLRFLGKQMNAAFDSRSLIAPAVTLDRADAAFVSDYLGVSKHPVIAPETTPSALAPIVEAPIASLPQTKTTLTVRVLNGTSTTGLAGTVKAQLEAAGYTHVSTGNASSKTTLTQIKTTATAVSAVADLASVLGNTYSLDTASVLPASSTFDVVIVVGSAKKN